MREKEGNWGARYPNLGATNHGHLEKMQKKEVNTKFPKNQKTKSNKKEKKEKLDVYYNRKEREPKEKKKNVPQKKGDEKPNHTLVRKRVAEWRLRRKWSKQWLEVFDKSEKKRSLKIKAQNN